MGDLLRTVILFFLLKVTVYALLQPILTITATRIYSEKLSIFVFKNIQVYLIIFILAFVQATFTLMHIFNVSQNKAEVFHNNGK